MNKYINFIILIFSVLLLTDCKNDNPKTEKEYTKINAEIPDLLKNDTAIVIHLNELSENLDNFAIIVEEIADGIDDIGFKDIKKPNLVEKLKFMSLIMPKVEPAMKLVKNLQELEKVSEHIKDTLPDNKKNAFQSFEDIYKARFDSLNVRFKKYIENNN